MEGLYLIFVSQALKNAPITVYGNGKQTRSFSYVADTAGGIYKLLMSDVNDPVNIGNPNEITLLKLADIIIRLTKSKSDIIFQGLPVDDPKVRRPDIARAKGLLRWKPKVALDDGLIRTIKYFKGI